ncbi:histidine kinase [Cryobacterium sp. PH31-AA6]|uniref:sensor histidine kinase n=1 Tax=Cryobacterium sp. PH31-AA6 TaxID=3046205 RepID=UPI0024B89B8B|nr:histidine kinase [Cryobacterium sp. PH31-AA6]MDJ0324210.1 histidine kinase [Cryobacterium sp. PH31-AA6]
MHPVRAYEVVTGLVRSAWEAPAAAPAPSRRVWRDWVLLVVVATLAVVEGIVRTDLTQPVVSVLGVVAIAPTVLWRRTRPLFMLVLAVVLTTPLELVLPDPVLNTSVFVAVLVYALFRWGSGRDLVLGSGILLGSLGLTFQRDGRLDDVIGGFALLLSVAVLGAVFRARAGSQQRNLDRIRMLEREHLARDLHDTVAHHVSAIAIRAQAGIAMAVRDPDAATDALGVIEAEAAKTLSELRSMVRVLRQHETAELAPSPGLSDIDQLAGTRPGGVQVSVRVAGDDGSIPPPVAAAVFRLAQESVTNALRHARQVTRVDVVVGVDEGGVRVNVTNDGDVAASPNPGFGIIGMMERAALLGGTCQSAPAPGGGWAVTATLPRVGWAA